MYFSVIWLFLIFLYKYMIIMDFFRIEVYIFFRFFEYVVVLA